MPEIRRVISYKLSAINCTNSLLRVQSIAPSEQVNKFLHAALSDNTRRSYQSDLSHFLAWGGKIPATNNMVSEYLAANSNLVSTATLTRRLVSISRAHTSQGLKSPTTSDLVKATLRGIRRVMGTAQRQVSPILKNNLIDMVAELTGTKGTRDRALLLIGFAGALRRSELVGIQYTDIEFVENGLLINLRRSKVDQEGYGRKIAIPHARGSVCAVRALKVWLGISKVTDGPLFRPITRHGHIGKTALSTQAVAIIVKTYALAIGLDATKFSGHSLRAGLVTSAAQAGVSSWKIKQQTGHKSDAMLNRYIRDSQIFIDNAAGALL